MLKENNLKVSIITVSYNASKTIEQTIQSVLNQTYGNIEYIIIDGASTDGTQSVIEKYKDRLAYYVSEPDGGIYDAMNKGIQKATGDVIGIINSDDWYEPIAAEEAVSCFASTGAEVVHGSCKHIWAEGTYTHHKSKPLKEIWFHMVTVHPSTFVKREVYERLGLFSTHYSIAADYELMLRLYSAGVKFEYINKEIVNFRDGGVSSTDIYRTGKETLEIIRLYADKCFDYDRETLSEQIGRYEQDWKFRSMINDDPQTFADYLRQYFCDSLRGGLYLFGSGVMGKHYLRLLRNTDIPIIAFADNNEAKWGTSLDGVPIKNPALLQSGEKYAIVLVKDYADEICRQLEDYGNEGLKWITLEEVRNGMVGIKEKG